VRYIRSDGRSTPGVDVPYEFDGTTTATASTTPASVGFSLVRIQAKQEAPLVLLINSSTIFTMLAQVTFYGADQAGNVASVTGSIDVNVGNFGDQ